MIYEKGILFLKTRAGGIEQGIAVMLNRITGSTSVPRCNAHILLGVCDDARDDDSPRGPAGSTEADYKKNYKSWGSNTQHLRVAGEYPNRFLNAVLKLL